MELVRKRMKESYDVKLVKDVKYYIPESSTKRMHGKETIRKPTTIFWPTRMYSGAKWSQNWSGSSPGMG